MSKGDMKNEGEPSPAVEGQSGTASSAGTAVREVNPSPDPGDEFAEFRPLIRAFARKVIKYGLSTPMIVLLEAEKPLNWILSQGLHVLNPGISVATEMFELATHEDLDKFARFLEDRRAFNVLIEEIERQEEHKKRLRESEKTRRG
jgi:hypothetical protein